MITAPRTLVLPHRRRHAAIPSPLALVRQGSRLRGAQWPWSLFGLVLLAWFAGAAPAVALDHTSAPLSPRAACLQAARAAERIHGLPDGLLVAVALAESGLHAYALNIAGRSHYANSAEEARRLYFGAPAGASIMAGCVQVNARVHAPRSDWPLEPYRAADWGGALLRAQYNRSGDWAEAIRRWNGGSRGTAQRLVCRVRAKMQVSNPGSEVVSGAGCAGGETARVARNGTALLEIAEAEGR